MFDISISTSALAYGPLGGGAMGSTAHPQIFGISHYLGNKSPTIRAKRITKLGKINENNNNFF